MAISILNTNIQTANIVSLTKASGTSRGCGMSFAGTTYAYVASTAGGLFAWAHNQKTF